MLEKMVIDAEGRVINPTFRNSRIPAFADIPRTEVLFADTHDAFGPAGAKSGGEGPFDPVAPALANAVADATGVRFRSLPLSPERIYRQILDRVEAGAPAGGAIAAGD